MRMVPIQRRMFQVRSVSTPRRKLLSACSKLLGAGTMCHWTHPQGLSSRGSASPVNVQQLRLLERRRAYRLC